MVFRDLGDFGVEGVVLGSSMLLVAGSWTLTGAFLIDVSGILMLKFRACVDLRGLLPGGTGFRMAGWISEKPDTLTVLRLFMVLGFLTMLSVLGPEGVSSCSVDLGLGFADARPSNEESLKCGGGETR